MSTPEKDDAGTPPPPATAPLIPVAEAQDRFEAQTGLPYGSWTWRELEKGVRAATGAHGQTLEVVKERGRWKVDPVQLAACVAAYQQESARQQEAAQTRAREQEESRSYPTGPFNSRSIGGGEPGVPHGGAVTVWSCGGCGQTARTLHEKNECHRCRDWSPCGDDCTLSALYCPGCRTRMEI